MRATWLIRPELIPVYVAWSDQGHFYSLCRDEMLVHRKVALQHLTHRYLFIHLVKRGISRVTNLCQEHNALPWQGFDHGRLDPESSTQASTPSRAMNWYDQTPKRCTVKNLQTKVFTCYWSSVALQICD